METVLPCVHCGAPLSGLVEGTTVVCFSCGTINGYLECKEVLDKFAFDLFEFVPRMNAEEAPSTERLEKQLSATRGFFQDLLAQRSVASDYVLISKIDDADFDPNVILELARSFGALASTTTDFTLPQVEGSSQANELQEIIVDAQMENLAFIALDFSILGKKAFEDKDVAYYFQQVAYVFAKLVEIISSEDVAATGLDFAAEREIFDTAGTYADLLGKAVFENPAYYSDDIEKLALKLKEMPEIPARGRVLLGQIMDYYDLAKSAMFLIKELRNANSVWEIDAYREKMMENITETLESVKAAADWITGIYGKFKETQTKLQRLHCGRILDYLKAYRTEFENRYTETTEKFDHLVEMVISNSTADYGLECVELFDRIEDLFGRQFDAETLINRLAAIKDEFEDLDGNLKSFASDLSGFLFSSSIGPRVQRDLVSAVADQHSQFDSKLLDHITVMFQDFMDLRNEQHWTIEKQREIFLSELKPHVKRIIDLSYTLHEDKMPYPLFMELIILKTVLVVGRAQRIVLLIENPSEISVMNLELSFLIPNSFDIIKRYSRLKLLKPHEKRVLGTQIIPTEAGLFYLMSMVQYDHLYEKYWLPSFKLSIEVFDESSIQGETLAEEELPADLPLSAEDRVLLKEILESGETDDEDDDIEDSEERADGEEKDSEPPDEGEDPTESREN
ncbi:MAG TPA: hypothetical protein VKK79_07495 [Candidatus Lokiarchaeia archaeon]|nr:hypothetical protein [Candidatus Lokiarchaeia archaeon]